MKFCTGYRWMQLVLLYNQLKDIAFQDAFYNQSQFRERPECLFAMGERDKNVMTVWVT